MLHEKPDTPDRRRLQLLLEQGSTTSVRLSELATTRLKGFRRELVDGEDAWLLDIIGKSGKLRTVMVFDEIKTLVEQHHQDMDATGLGFDARVDRSGARWRGWGCWGAGIAGRTAGRTPKRLARPLVGILKRPPRAP